MSDDIRDALASLAARYDWKLIKVRDGDVPQPIHGLVADQIMATTKVDELADEVAAMKPIYEWCTLHDCAADDDRNADTIEALRARLVEVERERDDAGRGWVLAVEANVALKDALSHYKGWFGDDCQCNDEDGECPIPAALAGGFVPNPPAPDAAKAWAADLLRNQTVQKPHVDDVAGSFVGPEGNQ